MRVQHRHIIYIQGYDPRGLAQYYRMFRTELRKFGRLYQLSATVSRPKAAADGETASWTIETKGGRLADANRLRLPALRGFHPERPRRADLAHGLPCRVDLLAPGVLRHHRPVCQSELAVCDLHHLSAYRAAAGGAWRRRHRLRVRNRPRRARCSPAVQHCGRDRAVRRAGRHHAEIHREQHLCALSAVGHDLDLGILAPPAPRMGCAHRPLCAASDQRDARPATPTRSSSSATVRDRFSARKFWRARCNSIPTSDGADRAWCC